MREFVIYTDGACSGNPGPAGIGFVIKEKNKVLKEVSKSIGQATNNIAEYTALVEALCEAKKLEGELIKVFTDSQLMHRQLIGAYKVKNEVIKKLFDQVQELAGGFAHVEIAHVLREKNKEADKLATQAIKSKKTNVVASTTMLVGEESPSSKG